MLNTSLISFGLDLHIKTCYPDLGLVLGHYYQRVQNQMGVFLAYT